MNPIKLNSGQLKLVTLGMFVCTKNATEAHQRINQINLEHTPSKRAIQRLFKNFKQGIFEFSANHRHRKPKLLSNSNTEIKRQSILNQRKVSVRKLSKITGLNRELIRRIIIRKLQARKLKPIRVPHKLTQELKNERVAWCEKMLQNYQNSGAMDEIITGDETYLFYDQINAGAEWTFPEEDAPKIPKMIRYTTRKRMFTLFFNTKGIVHVSYRKLNHAATAKSYKEQILKVARKFKKSAKIVIHDDNARIHCGKMMTKFYENSRNVKRLSHPRYSPDLAPNDFWLIGKLKRALENKCIDGERKLYNEVMKILKNIPADEYKQCFDKWINRMKECIERNGDYVDFRKRCIKRKV